MTIRPVDPQGHRYLLDRRFGGPQSQSVFSGQATTVKHAWAWLVLGLVTAWEHHELLAFKAEGSKKDRKWWRCKGRSDNRPNAAAGVAECV